MIINLKHKLMTWVENGLITSDQRQRILAFEDRQGSKPWVLYGIAGIGVTALVTGIISLVAANWEIIPAWLKLVNYFLIQSAAGFLYLRFDRKPGLWREVFLTTFSLLFFAGIGLIAQIYNLHGDGWEALLLWLGITLPITLRAQSGMICHIWMLTSLVTSWIWATAGSNIHLEEQRICLATAVPFLLTALGFWAQKFVTLNERFRTASVVWGIGALLICGTPMANFSWADSHHYSIGLEKLVVPWIALLIAVAGSLVRPNASPTQRMTTAALFVAVGIYLTIPVTRSEWHQHSVMGAIGFIVVWALAAAAASLANYRRLFDVASLVIAIRFIVIYFEVFGSLTYTGVGLIASGVVILGVVAIWYKLRKNIVGGKAGGA